MNPDEFESRLQRTPLKQPPGEWRGEILAATHPSKVADACQARSAELHSAVPQICNLPDATPGPSTLDTADALPNAIRRYGRVQLCATTKASPSSNLFATFADAWRMRLRELFWPHPVAWGALATVWIAIGAVHLALHEPGPPVARVHIAASPDMPTMITMQRELLASWEEPAEQPKAVPSRHLPPQSCIERRRETFEA